MNPTIPFRNLYSNDTTNLDTCVSPYHKRGGYAGREELRASVREVQGLADVHLIQLAHGHVPWYKSRLYSYSEHKAWWKEYFGVTDEQLNRLGGGCRYVHDGGDYLADFIEACRDFGQVPFVSLRINDEHHVENIDLRGHVCGYHSISRFVAENRDKMLGTDLSRWENRALNWIYPEIPAHMLSLVTEQCEDYDLDGYELDFQRHPNLFNVKETTFEERQAVVEKFISDVRAVLDRTVRNGRHRYLCVRVPCNLKLWNELGLCPEHLQSLGVEMVNVSPFFYCDQWVEREAFVQRMPDLAVYFEICHTTAQGKTLIKTGYDDFTFRRVTPNEIYSTAHLAYTAGAQGISFFNFHYYREHGCEGRGPFNEPPFHAVGNVRDRDFVARAPQHFFIAKAWDKNSQLEKALMPDEKHDLEMYLAEPMGGWQSDFRLRVTACKPLRDSIVEIFFNGVKATPVSDISEPYPEDNDYPPMHGDETTCCAYRVPLSAVQKGKNRLTLRLCGSPVKFNYIDIFPWKF